jgi:hypothetical protein
MLLIANQHNQIGQDKKHAINGHVFFAASPQERGKGKILGNRSKAQNNRSSADFQ